MSFSCDFRDHIHPVDDVVRFPFADGNQAMRVIGPPRFVFQVLDQDLDFLANLRLRFVPFPFIPRNTAFALEADVNDNEIVVHADDFSLDDLVEFKLVLIDLGFGENDIAQILIAAENIFQLL